MGIGEHFVITHPMDENCGGVGGHTWGGSISLCVVILTCVLGCGYVQGESLSLSLSFL